MMTELVEILKTFPFLGNVPLIALFGVLLFTGRIYPRKWHRDAMHDKDAQIERAREDSATWRKAYETVAEADALRARQIDQLVEIGRTSEHLLRAIQIRSETP